MVSSLRMAGMGRVLLAVGVVSSLTMSGCSSGHGHDNRHFEPRIVTPGQGKLVEFPGHVMHELLAAEHSHGHVSFYTVQVAPRSFGAPPHVHHDEDEYFYILQGELTLLNEDQVVTAPAGAFAALTRGHLHAFWNASDRDTYALIAVAPGDFGSFFDEVTMEVRRSHATDPQAVGAIITRLAAERHVEMHPEKVPESARPFLP